MILVIGGEGSGKLDYVKSLGYSEEQIADAALDEKPALNHLERLVRASEKSAEELLEALSGKETIICNEVGSGVIPAEREETLFRKKTGLLCILLVKKAETVVRMTCGIPTVIKGKTE